MDPTSWTVVGTIRSADGELSLNFGDAALTLTIEWGHQVPDALVVCVEFAPYDGHDVLPLHELPGLVAHGIQILLDQLSRKLTECAAPT